MSLRLLYLRRLAIERGPGRDTAFVNQWYTVENGTVAWKHISAGNDRVATQPVIPNGIPEAQRYLLHKDLQGDTNIVTDPTGAVIEHLEHFPGGAEFDSMIDPAVRNYAACDPTVSALARAINPHSGAWT